MKKILIGVFAATVLFSSCLKNVDIPPCNSTYDPCSFVAPAAEITQVEDYLTSKAIAGAIKHCSGMYYKIEGAGSGATADICSDVSFSYKGELANGTVFQETSTANPVTLRLGNLIGGFRNGIPLIKPGGRIRLFIPPSLGYGNQGQGNIPPNSMLIFQVDLTGVQ